MSQKKLSKSSNKSHLFSRKYVFMVFVLAPFTCLLAYTAYNRYAAHNEKWRFETAKKNIELTYNMLAENIGKPDNSRLSSFCSRPNVEFGEGPLSCNTGLELLYGVQSISEANSLLTRITTLLATSDRFRFISGTRTLNGSVMGFSLATTANQNYKERQGQLTCTANYAYDTPLVTYLQLTNNKGKKTFYMSLSCFDNASQSYFDYR